MSKILKEVVEGKSSVGKPHLIFVCGTTGSGKSHLIQKILGEDPNWVWLGLDRFCDLTNRWEAPESTLGCLSDTLSYARAYRYNLLVEADIDFGPLKRNIYYYKTMMEDFALSPYYKTLVSISTDPEEALSRIQKRVHRNSFDIKFITEAQEKVELVSLKLLPFFKDFFFYRSHPGFEIELLRSNIKTDRFKHLLS